MVLKLCCNYENLKTRRVLFEETEPFGAKNGAFWKGNNSIMNKSLEQIQVVVRAGLEPVTAKIRVRRAGHSLTLPANMSNANMS